MILSDAKPEKSAPYSEEMERGVLGSLMLDADRVHFLCTEAGVDESWFYIPSNRVIWSCINDMRLHGKCVDLLQVSDELKRTNRIDQAGGAINIEKIIENTPTSAHAEYYISKLRRYYLLRVERNIAVEVLATIDYGEDDPEDIAAHCVESNLAILDTRKAVSNEQIVKQALEKWNVARTGGVAGIPSPWVRFNERFGGLHEGVVTLFAGRAGTGKSSAAATWLHFLGTRGVPVAHLPFEDGVDKTWQRIAGIHGDFSVFHLDVGNSTEKSVQSAGLAMEAVMKMPIYMESRHMTISQIVSWATMQKARHGIRLLMLDAFKDILRKDMSVESDNIHSQALCELARRLNIPVLLCHHLRKRDQEGVRSRQRVSPDDLRGSGRLYDDCRQCILLQEFNDGDVKSYEFELCKNSYGPTGVFPMERVSNRCMWREPRQITTGSDGRAVSIDKLQ